MRREGLPSALTPLLDEAPPRAAADHVGSYQLEQQLGAGGVGRVYRATHVRSGRPFAVKVLRSCHRSRRELVERLFLEAWATRQVQHPGIVRIFEFGVASDGRPFLVMELLDGTSLKRHLRAAGRRLPLPEVLHIGREIALALSAAHGRGLVHRDLKPSNVMLVADAAGGAERRVKIIDFGLVKLLRGDLQVEQHAEGARAWMGTPHYMAPEQHQRWHETDDRADVYSLGVMLYEMLCGQRPFVADSDAEVLSMHLSQEPAPLHGRCVEVPPPLSRLIQGALARRPGDRPSMEELAELLGRVHAPALVAPAVRGADLDLDEPAALERSITDMDEPTRTR